MFDFWCPAISSLSCGGCWIAAVRIWMRYDPD